jgi:hypothetical protein
VNVDQISHLPEELARLTKLTDMCGGENTYEDVFRAVGEVQSFLNAVKGLRRSMSITLVFGIITGIAMVAFYACWAYFGSWATVGAFFVSAAPILIALPVLGVSLYRAMGTRRMLLEVTYNVACVSIQFTQLGMRCLKEKLESDLRRR